MTRYLGDVIDQILEIIPSTEVALLHDLNTLKQSVEYTAPEAIVSRWRQGAFILEEYISPEDSGWHAQVLNVWMDRR